MAEEVLKMREIFGRQKQWSIEGGEKISLVVGGCVFVFGWDDILNFCRYEQEQRSRRLIETDYEILNKDLIESRKEIVKLRVSMSY